MNENQENRPDFGKVYQKCKEYVDKLENKKICISDIVIQKINDLNVKRINQKSNNSFDDIVNIIESYIQLNREQQARDIIERIKNRERDMKKWY